MNDYLLVALVKKKETTIREKKMTIKEKEMKISQTYRADSAPQEPKSALRGLMQRLGLTLLACTLVIAATGSARAGEAQRRSRRSRARRWLRQGFPSEECRPPSIAIRRRWNLRDAAG